MSCWEVKENLSSLVGLSSDEEENALQLCRECFNEIAAGLKADADTEDARVTAAAAGLAYYKLMLKRNTQTASDEITSFKAGDVSISQGKADTAAQLKTADEYYRQCMSKLIPLCEDNGFAVKNVRIKVIP